MWLKITRSDFIGATFFLVGLGIFVGHWIAERNVNFDHVVAILAGIMMLVGAFLMIPANMKQATKDIVTGAKDVLPWTKKED